MQSFSTGALYVSFDESKDDPDRYAEIKRKFEDLAGYLGKQAALCGHKGMDVTGVLLDDDRYLMVCLSYRNVYFGIGNLVNGSIERHVSFEDVRDLPDSAFSRLEMAGEFLAKSPARRLVNERVESAWGAEIVKIKTEIAKENAKLRGAQPAGIREFDSALEQAKKGAASIPGVAARAPDYMEVQREL